LGLPVTRRPVDIAVGAAEIAAFREIYTGSQEQPPAGALVVEPCAELPVRDFGNMEASHVKFP